MPQPKFHIGDILQTKAMGEIHRQIANKLKNNNADRDIYKTPEAIPLAVTSIVADCCYAGWQFHYFCRVHTVGGGYTHPQIQVAMDCFKFNEIELEQWKL